MRKRLDAREITHATVPVIVVLLTLGMASLWGPAVDVSLPGGFTPLLALILIAGVATLYKPVGRQTPGLGALALPPAIWFFGLAWLLALS